MNRPIIVSIALAFLTAVSVILFLMPEPAASSHVPEATQPAFIPQYASAAQPIAVSAPEPPPIPPPAEKPVPTKITFPRFNIECDIVPVGLDSKDRMAVASSHKIATWYMYGASPGQKGNAILASHVRWQGQAGFFSILPKLELGEEVLIDFDNGTQTVFVVTLNEFYYLEEMPAWVMHLGGEGRVTLITCAGRHLRSINDSEARTIVLLKEKSEVSARQNPDFEAD